MNIETIWSEYQISLRAFLHKNISDPDDVEDLLQDILIKTYRNLETIKDSHKLKSWLFQIANRTIIDFYRQRGKNEEITEDDLWYTGPEKDLLQQLSSCVLPFIQSLPNEDAELLTAIEIEGISQKEYALQTGIKYSTLKSRVQKSRMKLYKIFANCCEFSLDSKGNLADFQQKKKNCSSC